MGNANARTTRREEFNNEQTGTTDAQIVLPGGGLMLIWQLGAISYIQENYDMQRVVMTGSSAGAIVAACAAAEIDYEKFLDRLIEKGEEMGVYNRRLGLVGVIGHIVHSTLEEFLPEEAAEKLEENRVQILVTPLNRIRRKPSIVKRFRSRASVLQVLKASSHLPFVADGSPSTVYQGRHHVDGSLLASDDDFLRKSLRELPIPVLRLRSKDDAQMKDLNILDCVKLFKQEELRQFFYNGQQYARSRDECGDYECLTPRRNRPNPEITPGCGRFDDTDDPDMYSLQL